MARAVIESASESPTNRDRIKDVKRFEYPAKELLEEFGRIPCLSYRFSVRAGCGIRGSNRRYPMGCLVSPDRFLSVCSERSSAREVSL